VCDLETSRMGAPYIYDISRLRVKPDDCYCLVQFSLDVFVYPTCLFGMYKFQACKSVHHCTIIVNHQPDATVFPRLLLTVIELLMMGGRTPETC